MKKKFDENLHDSIDDTFDETTHFNQQSEEEIKILRLTALLKENPKGCGELLSAIYFEEKDNETLAAEMGIPEATLRQRKKRCLDRFRKVW